MSDRFRVLPPRHVVLPGVEVTIWLQAGYDGDVPVAGIFDLKGKIALPPKAWLRVVRREMRELERIAREAGCAEMRVSGRDWSSILTDYEPMNAPTVRNGLRKALT